MAKKSSKAIKKEKALRRRKRRRGFAAFVICLIVFSALAFGARLIAFDPVKIASDAMAPDFTAGDIAVINKLGAWSKGGVSRGDTVYAKFGSQETGLVRTVTGMPGDYLEARGEEICLVRQDGTEENLGVCPGLVNGTIPAGAYLLTSNNGIDGRTLGLVYRTDIVGEACAVIWPVSRIGAR